LTYSLEIDGLEFEPIPENWIDHGMDRTGDGPQCLAVSVALLRNSTLKIRYAHPEYDTVGAMFYPALDEESGSLPDPQQWARSVNAARLQPVGRLRAVERDHLATLWKDRIRDVLERPERFQRRAVADGGTE